MLDVEDFAGMSGGELLWWAKFLTQCKSALPDTPEMARTLTLQAACVAELARRARELDEVAV